MKAWVCGELDEWAAVVYAPTRGKARWFVGREYGLDDPLGLDVLRVASLDVHAPGRMRFEDDPGRMREAQMAANPDEDSCITCGLYEMGRLLAEWEVCEWCENCGECGCGSDCETKQD